MTIAENIKRVQEIIAQACVRVNRDPDEVTLIAVSKTHPAEVVLEAVATGVQHFGENRVEEAENKILVVNARTSVLLMWHMIGHIQSRKAKNIVPLFQQVHSVDSFKLAGKLSSLAVERDIRLNIFLEINVSGEEAKHGIRATGWESNPGVRESVWLEVGQILTLPGLRVRGLMTMAPIVENMEQSRPVFASLTALRLGLAESFQVDLPDLSMGMTDDYPVAIEEGATMVRIGRAIFGTREK